jgi:ribosome-binding protein aMBF1 (putative translation factor)
LGLSHFGLKIEPQFDGRDDVLAKKSVFTTRYKTLKSLLLEARREKGLTQVELAAKLSRPQSFVSKYERGERRLDLVEFLEVADALGLQPAQFIKKLQ